MEQGFFPSAATDGNYLTKVAWHGLLLALAIWVIVLVFARKQRPASRRELAVWKAGVWGFPLAAFLVYLVITGVWGPVLAGPAAGFLGGFSLFSSICCLVGTWVLEKRLNDDQGKANAAIEALLILGVFLVLMAFLLPSTPTARTAARKLQCQNNLKSLLIAIYEYEEKWDQLPNTAPGDPPVSWRVQLLPYFQAESLYAQYDATKPWDDAANKQLGSQRVFLYDCPERRITVPSGDPWPTAYIIPTGPGALMQPRGKRQFKDATDGLSQTICLVEACGLEIPWTEPRDADISRQPIGVNLKGKGLTDSPGILSSPHAGLVNVVMADGSSRTVSQNIDPAVLKALLTADGSEEIPADWDAP